MSRGLLVSDLKTGQLRVFLGVMSDIIQHVTCPIINNSV